MTFNHQNEAPFYFMRWSLVQECLAIRLMFLARLSRNQPYVLQDVMRDFVQSRQSIPNEVQIECSTHQLGSVVRKQVSLTINET